MSDDKDSHFRVCHQGSEGSGGEGEAGVFLTKGLSECTKNLNFLTGGSGHQGVNSVSFLFLASWISFFMKIITK